MRPKVGDLCGVELRAGVRGALYDLAEVLAVRDDGSITHVGLVDDEPAATWTTLDAQGVSRAWSLSAFDQEACRRVFEARRPWRSITDLHKAIGL